MYIEKYDINMAAYLVAFYVNGISIDTVVTTERTPTMTRAVTTARDKYFKTYNKPASVESVIVFEARGTDDYDAKNRLIRRYNEMKNIVVPLKNN